LPAPLANQTLTNNNNDNNNNNNALDALEQFVSQSLSSSVSGIELKKREFRMACGPDVLLV
jgi:hypothetical protein